MKELTIEQKAKAYDNLLVKLQEAKVDNNVCDDRYCCVIDVIVPELKESEDERIRKEMIDYIKNIEGQSIPLNKYNSWLSWLENQGEMGIESYKAAEDEKREFVGDGFIKCYADFQDFKEGKTYWLEYVGNDNYNVRSDNLLGKTYHITPCQLYTVFKKQTWLEKQGEQKPAEWSEEDESHIRYLIECLEHCKKGVALTMTISTAQEYIDWLKFLKDRYTWKPSDE